MSHSLFPEYGHENHGQRKEVRRRQNENECVCRRVQPHGGFVTLIICLDSFHVYRCQEGTKGPLCPASKESGYQKCDGVKRIEFLRHGGSDTSASQCHKDSGWAVCEGTVDALIHLEKGKIALFFSVPTCFFFRCPNMLRKKIPL